MSSTKTKGHKRKPKLDVERIRDAADDRWPEILATLAGLDIQIFDGRHGPCPRKCNPGSGGKDRFRMAYPDRGAVLCNQCFREKNGDGFAAIGWLNNLDFLQSVAAVALHLGIDPPAKAGRPKKPKKPPAKWNDRIKIRPWNEAMAALWCFYKPGITPEVIRRVGKLATFRDSLTVLAFLIWQPDQAKPVGAVLYRVSAAEIPTGWNDATKEWERSEPVLVAFNSKPGICGEFRKLEKFPEATVWITEGSTDGLALMASVPPGEQNSHIVIWNACGSEETPPTWLPKSLAGRSVNVIRDCDESGEAGLEKWSKAIATEADAVPIVLPYEVKISHGADLRDFLNDPAGGWLPLLALAESIKPIEKSEAELHIEEHENDPHRLARIFKRCYDFDGESGIVFHREEFRVFTDGAYRLLPSSELRAKVTETIKSEFDLLYFDDVAFYEENIRGSDNDDGPPKVRKITATLVNNVILALTSETLLPGRVEPPAWLGDPEVDWKPDELLATRSGLIHLSSLDADRPSVIAVTPKLFSFGCLDYDFDPAAKCPHWDAFLESIWGDDQQSICCLQSWFGYNLLPDIRQHKILLIIGPPRCGKSTIGRQLKATIGSDNVASPKLASLSGDFGLWPLLNKRAAVIADALSPGRGSVAIVENLLSISGEDPQDIARKGLPTLTGVHLPVRFMLMANELPNLQNASGAMVKRVVLLKITRNFYGREDKGLDEKLSSERPGILNWAIRGWQRLQRVGAFEQPESGQETLDALGEMSSPIATFIRDYLIVSPELTVNTTDAWLLWKTFCDRQGRDHPGTQPVFGKGLRAVLPDLKITRLWANGTRERKYEGIGIRSKPEPETKLESKTDGKMGIF